MAVFLFVCLFVCFFAEFAINYMNVYNLGQNPPNQIDTKL